MTKNENIRLCGGTFFTLLLEARKPRLGVREHYMGDTDGLSEPETLMGLAKVIVPDFEKPLSTMMKTIKGNTFEFKSCENKGGTYFPFSNRNALKAFDERIKSEYTVALNSMISFCNEFIHMKDSTKKDETLIKALIELIDSDDSISPEQLFYTNEDGTAVCKSKLIGDEVICFQSFLLGIFHFAVMRKEPAKFGKDTYDMWCPPKGGAPRVYEGNVGEHVNHQISLSYVSSFDKIDAEVIDMVEDKETEERTETKKEVNSSPQMTFNFNVTGNNNSFYNHVDTVNNYYGGKKDGQ